MSGKEISSFFTGFFVGALVGGAALKVDSFTDLVRIAAEVKGKM